MFGQTASNSIAITSKPGSYVYPALSRDKIVMLMFNGSRAFVSCGEKVYHVTEPAFFLPDFDKQPYLVGAVEDTEFILCEFGMNEEDWKSYRNWHRRLPFFKLYTDGVRYDQACKMPGTCSWSILPRGCRSAIFPLGSCGDRRRDR